MSATTNLKRLGHDRDSKGGKTAAAREHTKNGGLAGSSDQLDSGERTTYNDKYLYRSGAVSKSGLREIEQEPRVGT